MQLFKYSLSMCVKKTYNQGKKLTLLNQVGTLLLCSNVYLLRHNRSKSQIMLHQSFTFGIEDYVVFFTMLGISSVIGIYFGFYSKSNKTTDEYLLGGKNMKTLPIAISLVASQISGISIMSLPAETYSYGITYLWNVVSVFVFVPTICGIIIPIFYNNNITNCYQYLDLRFNKATRHFITFTFVLNTILMLPVIIFVPTLAFTQVTGVSNHLINIIVCSICSFYTLMGGLKAVVWTDVVQGIIMMSSVVAVSVTGIYKVGSIAKVLEHAGNGGRLHVSYSLDPRIRSTAWNTFLAGTFMWIGYLGLNQMCVQRIVSLPSLGHARRALVLAGIFFFVIIGFNTCAGVIMFAYYYDCDPIKAGFVNKADKLIPFFVQDILGDIKGMPGVFIACIFSAALSTMSAMLNSLAAVVYFDYIRPFIKHSDQRAYYIMKALIVTLGTYCILGGFIVQRFSSLFQIAQIIFGITGGALVGVFLLGILVPRASGGATVCSIGISLLTLTWIIVGTHFQFKSGALQYIPLPTRADGCDSRLGKTEIYTMTANLSHEQNLFRPSNILIGHKIAGDVTTALESNAKFSIYDLSFYWYKVIGALIIWLVAIPLSYFIPNREDAKLDPKLFAPFVRRFLPQRVFQNREETLLTHKNGSYI